MNLSEATARASRQRWHDTASAGQDTSECPQPDSLESILPLVCVCVCASRCPPQPPIRCTQASTCRKSPSHQNDVVYEILPARQVTAPAPKPSKAKRRKRHEKEDHMKKPPNAFMMFLKENRRSVAAGMNIKTSTEVNTILGQIWRSMTMDEQNKYYNIADEELRRGGAAAAL
nr:transcription factor 7-like 1-C [Nerophis lumbriciformis]